MFQPDDKQQQKKKGIGFVDPLSDTVGAMIDYMFLDKKQKLNIVIFYSKLPALTAKIFLRKKLGYRALKPFSIIFMAFLISSLSHIVSWLPFAKYKSDTALLDETALMVFAVAMVVIGFWQRHQRWNDFKQGILWHSYSDGISHFSFLPINENLCNRFVDPIFWALLGVVVMGSGEQWNREPTYPLSAGQKTLKNKTLRILRSR